MKYAFRSLLMNAPAVSAIVGTRIEWTRAAQGAPLPLIVLNIASETGHRHMQGPNLLREYRVQVDSYGNTPTEVYDLSEAVRTVLDGHRGGQFQGIFFIVSRDFDENSGQIEAATRPYRVSADYETYWSSDNA